MTGPRAFFRTGVDSEYCIAFMPEPQCQWFTEYSAGSGVKVHIFLMFSPMSIGRSLLRFATRSDTNLSKFSCGFHQLFSLVFDRHV